MCVFNDDFIVQATHQFADCFQKIRRNRIYPYTIGIIAKATLSMNEHKTKRIF